MVNIVVVLFWLVFLILLWYGFIRLKELLINRLSTRLKGIEDAIVKNTASEKRVQALELEVEELKDRLSKTKV